MRAVVLKKYGDAKTAFSIEEVNDPGCGEEDVIIRSEAFGLNFADVMARRGLYADAPKLPAVLGYEVLGTVVEQGRKVPAAMNGKRVLAFTRFGGYGNYCATGYKACVEVDSKNQAGELLALATQYSTAWYASRIATTVSKNDLVVQHAAAGGVGIALTQLCHLAGAKVIGLTGNKEKFEVLKKNQCIDFINHNERDYAKTVKEKYGKVDVVFNSVAGSTFKKDLGLLNFGGRLVCYGAAERMKGRLGILSTLGMVMRMGRVIPVKMLIKSQSLVGVNMLRIADHRPDILQTCMKEVVELYNKGSIKPLADLNFSVNEIAYAHSLFEDGKTSGKIAIHW